MAEERPLTVSAAVEGGFDVLVGCFGCQHWTRLDAAAARALLAKHGVALSLERLGDRARCTGCGRRGGVAWAVRPGETRSHGS